MMRIAFALHDKLPGTTLEDCRLGWGMVGTIVAVRRSRSIDSRWLPADARRRR